MPESLDDILRALETALAGNPTPGPWEYDEPFSDIIVDEGPVAQLMLQPVDVNGRYIAACSPERVRLLVEALRERSSPLLATALAEHDRLRRERTEARVVAKQLALALVIARDNLDVTLDEVDPAIAAAQEAGFVIECPSCRAIRAAGAACPCGA